MQPRVVFHVDLDCFYAGVAMRDDPSLRHVPLVIGTDPRKGGRGVALTANYVARRYGVRSAMPAGKVVRLCPQAVFVPPDWTRIREASDAVMDVLARYADVLEVVGSDEAYLDVTSSCLDEDGAIDWDLARSLARSLQAAVKRQTGLSISVGGARQRSVAKIASDHRKPHGVCVVPPQECVPFLAQLPVRKIPGCGPKTTALLADQGIVTVAQLRMTGVAELRGWLGAHADWMLRVAAGEDDRPVQAEHSARKSRSNERTYFHDESDAREVHATALRLGAGLVEDQANDGRAFATVTVKLRYADFTTLTRAHTFPVPLEPSAPDGAGTAVTAVTAGAVAAVTERLLAPLLDGRPVRLVGVRLSNFTEATGQRGLSSYGFELPAARPAGAEGLGRWTALPAA